MVILNLRLQSSALAAGLPLVERVCLAQLGKLLTSFLVAAELALKYGDLLFVLLDGFDIELEHRPVRERHRLGNAQINADLAGTTRTVVGEIHLRHDRDKPMPAFDGNRHLLDLALNRTRLSESHEACLRDADSTVGLVPIRRANLRNAEGIPVAPSLELWEALFLSLERLDCSRRVHQALLKCLRRRFQQPQHVVFLFPQHQPSGQLRVLEKGTASAVLSPCSTRNAATRQLERRFASAPG